MNNNTPSKAPAHLHWRQILNDIARKAILIYGIFGVFSIALFNITITSYLSDHHAQWLEPSALSATWLPVSVVYAFAAVVTVLIFPTIFQTLIQIPFAQNKPQWCKWSQKNVLTTAIAFIVLAAWLLYCINESSELILIPLAIVAIASAAILDALVPRDLGNSTPRHGGNYDRDKTLDVNTKDNASAPGSPSPGTWPKYYIAMVRMVGAAYSVIYMLVLFPHSELVRTDASIPVSRPWLVVILILVVEVGVFVSSLSWWTVYAAFSAHYGQGENKGGVSTTFVAAVLGLVSIVVIGASQLFNLPFYVVRELGIGGRRYVYILKKKEPMLPNTPPKNVFLKEYGLQAKYDYKLCQIWRLRHSFFVTNSKTACQDRLTYKPFTIFVLPVNDVLAIGDASPGNAGKRFPQFQRHGG